MYIHILSFVDGLVKTRARREVAPSCRGGPAILWSALARRLGGQAEASRVPSFSCRGRLHPCSLQECAPCIVHPERCEFAGYDALPVNWKSWHDVDYVVLPSAVNFAPVAEEAAQSRLRDLRATWWCCSPAGHKATPNRSSSCQTLRLLREPQGGRHPKSTPRLECECFAPMRLGTERCRGVAAIIPLTVTVVSCEQFCCSAVQSHAAVYQLVYHWKLNQGIFTMSCGVV